MSATRVTGRSSFIRFNGIDQFFRFEEGTGVVDIDGVENQVEDGSGVIVPSGARHNVRNTGDRPLKLYTI